MTIDAPTLLRAAQAAAGSQQYPKGALYVVATPIGNLADISLRALYLLSLADTVACEDTRHSGQLLRHLGLSRPLLALHEHNEAAAAQQVCERLAEGQRVAYVSDAGTPAVSDPGAVLVAAVRAAGHPVVPLPGASSVLAALSVAGDRVGAGFRFAGFLPGKGAERQAALATCAADHGTVVLFEAPHRIESLAQALSTALPERTVTVCRELTKQFETVCTMPASAMPAWLAADSHRGRGEFALVLHAVPTSAEPEKSLPAAAEHVLRCLLAELPLKQAVSLAAQISGAPRNALYDTALAWRQEATPRGGNP